MTSEQREKLEYMASFVYFKLSSPSTGQRAISVCLAERDEAMAVCRSLKQWWSMRPAGIEDTAGALQDIAMAAINVVDKNG